MLLQRRLHSHHWLGMVLICAGAALVAASSSLYQRGASHARQPQTQPQLGAGGGGGHQAAAAPPRAAWWGWLGKGGAAAAAPDPLLGNVLVVLAQLAAATQFIVEEKYLARYRAPVLLAVVRGAARGCWAGRSATL